MKKSTYADLTNDELLKKMNFMKQALRAFVIIYFVAIVIVAFMFFYNDYKATFTLMIPIFLVPLALTPLYLSYNMLKQEYKSRKS